MELKEYSTEDFLLNDSFVRYCLQANERDIQFWENWKQQIPAKEHEIAEARKLLFSLGLRLSPAEKNREFQKLKKLIQESIAKENSTTRHERAVVVDMPQRNRVWKWMAIAGAACLLLFAGYGLKWLADANAAKNAGTVLAYTVYSSNAGERKTLELVDGSSVILNSNSTLKIPSDFNVEKRNLQLTGEAFFDVAKNKEKPFIVSSKNISVKALGTSFKVRYYDFDTAMRVALLEGKVDVKSYVNNNHYTQLLLPGEEVSINAVSANMFKSRFDIALERDWKEDRLIFRDASLTEIAQQLEYWYGLKVNLVTTNTKKIRFNGEFFNKDIEKVLDAITYVNKLSYSLNNKEITIISK